MDDASGKERVGGRLRPEKVVRSTLIVYGSIVENSSELEILLQIPLRKENPLKKTLCQEQD